MHESLESRLIECIAAARERLIDDLTLHVGIATGLGNSDGLDRTRELLTARLRAIGASVELVAGEPKPDWLYGSRPGEPAPPVAVCRRSARSRHVTPILISGHLDTVHDPAGPFRHLSIAPDGNTATGPGCVDMKGGLVIALAALEALHESGIDADWTVILNSDEETGSYHSEAALRREAQLTRDRGGVGLVVEPALPDGSLAIERLGSGQFMLEARGRAAHVGRDFEQGRSAVSALAEGIVAVSHLPDVRRGMIANIGPVEGGHATNVVPDHARAWGNVRFPSQEIADELEARLKDLCTEGERLPGVEVRTSFNRPAKPATPEVMTLAEAARRVAEDLGQRLPFGKTGGVCDGNILQDAGLPTIDTLGVRGGGLHTPQEWIELASLVERCQLLAVLIARISVQHGR
jgi:glutamate carboxypeptidase